MTDSQAKKPRILHVRASNFVGGPERQILRYAQTEREGDYEIVIAVFCGDEEGLEFSTAVEKSGLNLLRLPAGSKDAFQALSAYLRSNEIALICCHGYKADILGVIAGRRNRIPTAVFLRGWTGEDRKVRTYEALDRKIIRFADRIVCLSQTQANEPGLAPMRERIRIVTNAIAVPEHVADHESRKVQLCSELGLSPQNTLIASAGRLSPEKGTAYFLHAARLIHERFQNTSFIVFGDGRERSRLEQLKSELNLSESLVFAGHRPDFPSLLPGVDVFVNPSLAEQSPNVVLEAMASGVAVVATAVGSVAEIGSDGSLISVEPGSPEKLAKAVAQVLDSPDLQASLRVAGPHRIATRYSLKVQQTQLRNLYGEFSAIAHASSLTLTEFPFISVVVPVRNEGKSIANVLNQLLQQEYPRDRYEVIVADGRSIDDTREVVQKIGQRSAGTVRLVDNPGIRSSAGRNAGIVASRGEIVAFIDGHCAIPSKHLLGAIAEIMLQTGSDCLARPQPLTVQGNDLMQSVIAAVRATTLGHGTDSTIYSMSYSGVVNPTSSGAVYRRDVFDRIGLYDENFDACEDVELNFRVHQAGLRSYIDPRLTVFYEPRKTLSGLFQQMTRYGRGRFRFQSKHPESRSLGQLVPPGLLLFLILTLLVGVSVGHLPWIFAICWALYLLAILATAIGLAIKNGLRYLFLAPPVYWAIHFGLGYGFWAEALSRLRKRKPQTQTVDRDIAQTHS